MAIEKPLFAQVGSATPQTEGSTLRVYSIGGKLCHQGGKSALVLKLFIGPHEEHVHKECLRLGSRILSSTPIFPSLKHISEGPVLLLEAGAHKESFSNLHYCKLTHLKFRNMETNILHHTVLWLISNLSTSPTTWCCRSIHGRSICRNIVKQSENVSEKSKIFHDEHVICKTMKF